MEDTGIEDDGGFSYSANYSGKIKKFLDSRAGDPEGKALIRQALNMQFADIAGARMRDKIKQESGIQWYPF